jgi:hypothetical protein
MEELYCDAGIGTVAKKTISEIATMTTTQTTLHTIPKISRFRALFGSLSLFTAQAMMPPMNPKKKGTRYQAPLTGSTGLGALG